MCWPAATAARMARDPEWWKVPSPRLVKKCDSVVNGEMPIHCIPSPPIWVMPRMWPRRPGASRVIIV